MVQYDVKPTDKVAVIGIGGLGHMALQFCNAWGCDVTAFTSTDAKREEALAMGAHQTLNSRDTSAIRNAAGRFDLILSTVNVKLDWSSYLGTLNKKGRLHFLGATLEPMSLSVPELTVNHIEPHTEHFKFEEVNEALAYLKSGNARYRVVLSR